jgi:hypothetical protein
MTYMISLICSSLGTSSFQLCEPATSPALATIPPLSLVVRSRESKKERERGVGTCDGYSCWVKEEMRERSVSTLCKNICLSIGLEESKIT